MLECLISQRAIIKHLFRLWNGLLEKISGNPTMPVGDGISNSSSHSVTNQSTPALSNISSTPTIIKCIGLVFVVLVCIFGNSVMVIGIRKTSHMRSNSNVLVASLTIADIIMGMGALVQVVVQPYVYVFSNDPCSHKKLIAIVFILVRIAPHAVNAHLVSITVDRYVAIVYPLFYSTRVTTTTAYFFIISSWIYGLLVVIPLLQYLRFVDWSSCDLPYSLRTVAIVDVGSYVIISVTMVTMFGKILLIAREHRIKIEAISVVTHTIGRPGYDLQAEFKAARLTAQILVVYIVLYFPFHLGRFLQGLLGDMRPYSQYFVDVGISLIQFSSSINWIVYGMHDREFRKSVFKIVCLASIRDNFNSK